MGRAAEVETTAHRNPKDFPIYILLISSIPLTIVLFCFGLVAFGAVVHVLNEDFSIIFPPVIKFIPGGGNIALWNLLGVFIVAYLATYLFIIRDLLRAVSNFDFGPTTLLASSIHVLFGVTTAVIIAIVATEVFGSTPGTVSTAVILIAAFAVGFVPELGLRALLRASQLWFFKREDEDVYRAFSATPLEVIDGIDSDVRSRLNLFNIVTVQNLATANPIMLFVETPYGVYQIIDWVGQAQLCAAVGAKGMTTLWGLGIRTIFDFEQAVLGPLSTPMLRHEIGKMVFSGKNPSEAATLGLVPNSKPSSKADKCILALANLVLDDLHIHRMRQIWNRISQRLGPENTRLRFSDSCDPTSTMRELKSVA